MHGGHASDEMLIAREERKEGRVIGQFRDAFERSIGLGGKIAFLRTSTRFRLHQTRNHAAKLVAYFFVVLCCKLSRDFKTGANAAVPGQSVTITQ